MEWGGAVGEGGGHGSLQPAAAAQRAAGQGAAHASARKQCSLASSPALAGDAATCRAEQRAAQSSEVRCGAVRRGAVLCCALTPLKIISPVPEKILLPAT